MAKVLNFSKPKQTFWCVKDAGSDRFLKVTGSYSYISVGEGKGSVWNSKLTAGRIVDVAKSEPIAGDWKVHPVEVSCAILASI